MTVTDKDGKVFIRESDTALNIERNRLNRLGAFEVTADDFLNPNQAIYYSTTDNIAISLNENADFGANLVSNDYSESNNTCVMVFDGNVTKIGDCAFDNCETLTDIMIPGTVETIGDYAFAGCTSLGASNPTASPATMAPAKAPARSNETTIVIPDGVTSIGAYAFQGCISLTSIIIPDSVISIGDGAFKECTNLTDIDIPKSVTDMGNNVFNGCASITSVTIPDGVTRIDDYAFAGCSNLTEVIIPESVTSIGKHAFDDCENLVRITLPDGVTQIEEFAFAACMSLTNINIPDGVTSIGSSAFESCKRMTNITLPSNVESIGNFAFANCDALTSLTIQAVTPPSVTDITFEEMNECPIYVPTESFTAYKEADGWSNYASRIHTIAPASSEINGHAFIDMGTGLKWASMNVGATAEGEDGDLFVWSAGKAAAENWGGNWRLPTKEEFEILMDESKYTWTWDSTNEGYIVESKIPGYVGNMIFLPTTGLIDPDTESSGTFEYLGCYWSSTPGEEYGSYHLEFEDGEIQLYPYVHEVALGVRPVAD